MNTASRFQTAANPGEAYISEETYDSMTDKAEVYCRFIKTTTLKGKDEEFKVYKVFWNKEEAEKTIARGEKASPTGRRLPNAVKIILMALIPLLIILAITLGPRFLSRLGSSEERRSINHGLGATDAKQEGTKDANTLRNR